VFAEFILYLTAATEFGVQAVEKPQKPLKFGKIDHQKKGEGSCILHGKVFKFLFS